MGKAVLDSIPRSLSLSGQDEAVMDTSSSSLSLAGDEDANQLYGRSQAKNPHPLTLTNEEKKAVYDGYRGTVLHMQYHSTAAVPDFFFIPSDEKTVIG